MTKKIKTNYNIDKNVVLEFNKIAEEKAINKSKLIEILILEWINKQNIKNATDRL
jgi:hypothetical protein